MCQQLRPQNHFLGYGTNQFYSNELVALTFCNVSSSSTRACLLILQSFDGWRLPMYLYLPIMFCVADVHRFDSCDDRLHIWAVLSFPGKVHPGCDGRAGVCSPHAVLVRLCSFIRLAQHWVISKGVVVVGTKVREVKSGEILMLHCRHQEDSASRWAVTLAIVWAESQDNVH